MTLRQLKTGYFTLEGLNSFATSFYFYYLFFFMEKQFGFGNLGNLSMAALNGLVYAFMAWLAGRLGQRFGYFKALHFGFSVMALALLAGAFASSVAGQIAVLLLWTMGICFTWPMLEALASEGEDSAGLQQMIGIYNVVWAGASALAYFTGGLLIETLGVRSLFWIPLAIHLLQNVLLLWLRSQGAASPRPQDHGAVAPAIGPLPARAPRADLFRRMAWLANPFAYVAINTVAAVVPGLARNLNLSPMFAGFFCSVWFFARVAMFLVLWFWAGWHYRLRWFLSAYLLLIASFASILLVPRLSIIVVAQVAFGLSVGLIYYSSLYYSMDVSQAKGEHGGVHEAAIGAGLFGGPAIGAVSLQLFPNLPNSSAWAVSLALCGGLIGLFLMLRRRPAPETAIACTNPLANQERP